MENAMLNDKLMKIELVFICAKRINLKKTFIRSTNLDKSRVRVNAIEKITSMDIRDRHLGSVQSIILHLVLMQHHRMSFLVDF